ncbi:MAG: hypothetical protein IT159_04395 [Bryobacterales bacterium]|nr:hypothetical protein [Bryobacterales bacterium]
MRLILIMALAAMTVLTMNAADVAGAWKGTLDTEMGALTMTITIKAGPGVEGDFTSDMVQGQIQNGKLDGDKISFQVDTGYGKLGFEGTVAGDQMKLTLTGTTGNKYPLICKRQK